MFTVHPSRIRLSSLLNCCVVLFLSTTPLPSLCPLFAAINFFVILSTIIKISHMGGSNIIFGVTSLQQLFSVTLSVRSFSNQKFAVVVCCWLSLTIKAIRHNDLLRHGHCKWKLKLVHLDFIWSLIEVLLVIYEYYRIILIM